MPRVTNETPAVRPAQEGPPSPFRGVIWDWGGVMTNSIREMVAVWLDDEDVDHEHYAAVMRPWVIAAYDQNGETNPIHALERGECTTEEFEQLLASRIARRDGVQVAAGRAADPDVRRVHAGRPDAGSGPGIRAAGLRTGLLSNSWGMADYPRHLFPGMFDVVVISGEVGMRKPEERIFRHAAGLLGLDAGAVRVHRRHRGQRDGRRGARDDRDPAPRPGGDARPARRTSRPSRSPADRCRPRALR